MFELFKSKGKNKTSKPHSEPQSDDTEFYQAVINLFVRLIDAYAEDNPKLPNFRARWSFSLSELNAWTQNETGQRMSCKVTAKDVQGQFSDFSEWVHGFGNSMDDAFKTGFSNWIATDLPVLIDVIQQKATLSTEVSFENKASGEKVRGILGPMQLWSMGELNACCNNCIFTQALQATNGNLMSRKTPYLIKAVVARNPDNTTTSDFRVNGVQDDEIASALSEWAKSWGGDGFVMRKQSLLFV